MKHGWIWFVLTCKRYLKKVSFLLILLVLPVAAFLIRGLEQEEGQEVRIAVYAEGMEERGIEGVEEQREGEGRKTGEGKDRGDGINQREALEDELLEALVQETTNEERPLFRFYVCSSEEQVKDQVASRQAECGYVISRDLREKLDEKNYKRCIRVYSAPSTVLASLSTEVVFASLMRLYDREIFLDYIAESVVVTEQGSVDNGQSEETESTDVQLVGIQPDVMQSNSDAEMNEQFQQMANQEGIRSQKTGIKELAGELYDKWLNNGSTFRFEYRYGKQTGNYMGKQADSAENGEEAAEEGMNQEEEALRVFPVRGIVAVYLLLVGLYSAVMLGTDEKKGLFLPLSPGMKLVCRIAVLAAPVFLGALSAFGGLAAGGCLQEPILELGIIGMYAVAVCVFAYGMKVICRRPQVICCLIPLFLVGSLVFTPVFVDIRQFFPALGWIEKLFLPSYYLRAF